MIKNIVFDFGGVLLDLDPQKTYDALSELMGVDIEDGQIPSKLFKIFLGYEKGEINTEAFLWNLQKESSKLSPQPDRLIKAWNKMLLGWNPKRFEFLRTLRNDYKVYLLSNTNDLHIEWVMNDLRKNHKVFDFDTQFFEKTFYSHIMEKRKPEIEIYNQVAIEAKINPSESLFIDDNIENIEGAIKAGFHAQHHDPSTEIIDVLPKYLATVQS